MTRILTPLLLLLCLTTFCTTSAKGEEVKTRVAYVPVTLEGDYLPVDQARLNEVLMAAFQKSAPELEFVPLQMNWNDNLGNIFEEAAQAARQEGADLIAWGTVSFEKATDRNRTDLYNRGRLKFMVTVNANIQVASASDGSRILAQPTQVTSTEQSQALADSGDPELEKKLAEEGLREAAATIVDVVQRRRALK